MSEILALGRDYGWTIVFVAFVAWGIWQLRDKWMALLDKRVALSERERVEELNFDDAMRKRLLNGDNYTRVLVERLLQMYDDERTERKAMVVQIMAQTAATEKLEQASLDTMLRFVDISRIQSERVTVAIERQTAALEENSKIGAATWFVLTKLYGARGGDVESALAELESSDP